MKKAEIMNTLTRKFYRVGFKFKKHSPEILVGAGVVGVVASAVMACKANLIDIHNALHALGLRSDEQAEEFNKRHVMKLVNMYARRGYDITKK